MSIDCEGGRVWGTWGDHEHYEILGKASPLSSIFDDVVVLRDVMLC